MILFVNGDSHAAAAEAVNPHAWAQDDELYWALGQRPHPDNERVSFGCELANSLNAVLECAAQSGSSNARIMRTTKQWLKSQTDIQNLFVVIQWSTWERQEWFMDGTWWQVNASGVDHVPPDLQSRYRRFVSEIDWHHCRQQAHDEIWSFHQELQAQKIRHVMFNGNNHFGDITSRRDWGARYMHPYLGEKTLDSVLKNHGFQTVNANSWHFGPDAHCFWADYLLQYMIDNQLLDANEIPTY